MSNVFLIWVLAAIFIALVAAIIIALLRANHTLKSIVLLDTKLLLKIDYLSKENNRLSKVLARKRKAIQRLDRALCRRNQYFGKIIRPEIDIFQKYGITKEQLWESKQRIKTSDKKVVK
jgi:uncharacterized membrane protein YraQ (UPF0718 family)